MEEQNTFFKILDELCTEKNINKKSGDNFGFYKLNCGKYVVALSDGMGKGESASKESEVVVVAVPDKPNGLNSTLAILDDANINLEYIYAFVSSQPNEAIVAMKVEDTEKAIKVFEENNAKILKKEDLEKI